MSRASYITFFLCFVFLFFKFCAVYLTDFDLFGDEAQYWIWSQDLDLGYYSKPPLLAWFIGLVCWVFGNNFFVIKLIPILMYCLNSYVIFLLTKKLFKNVELAFLTAITFFLMPVVSVSSFLISTDVILVFFWSLCLLQLLRVIENQNTINFVLLGLFLGLAFLTKYAAIYFIICFVFLLTLKKVRVIFFEKKLMFLLVIITFFVVISPNILWNINNGWTTLLHTADNAALDRIKFNYLGGLEFFVAQIMMIGPIISLFAFYWFIGFFKKNFEVGFLLVFSLPIFFIVIIEAFLVRANANWAAVSLISFLILFVYTVYNFNIKIIAYNNLLNLAFGFIFYILIATSSSLTPFKRVSGISHFAESLTTHLSDKNEVLVVSDRLLFSNLSYIFRDKKIEIYVPHNSNKRISNHFQMTRPLVKNFNKDFVFIGSKDDLSYLTNKYKINILKNQNVSFKKGPVVIYEVVF